jgi:hypothetical protein
MGICRFIYLIVFFFKTGIEFTILLLLPPSAGITESNLCSQWDELEEKHGKNGSKENLLQKVCVHTLQKLRNLFNKVIKLTAETRFEP